MIKNGKPYTNENGRTDNELLCGISQDSQKIVLSWIKENIIPRKSALYGLTSYGLKHYLENDTGIYLTSNQFKDAMLISGYMPVNQSELNWEYRISKKSPIFRRRLAKTRRKLFG